MNDPHIVSNYLSTGLRARLARWIGGQPTTLEMVEVISKMSVAIEDLARTSTEERATLTGLIEQVDRLEKQEVRTGKEQYKANLLAETQQQSVKDMLAELRQTETLRDRELAALRERISGARGEGRLEIAQQLFPVIEGLDEALASGYRGLAQNDGRETGGQASFFARLFGRNAASGLRDGEADAPKQSRVKSWLAGLELVRERLLDILAAQGITPIEAEGEAFDPRWHVAVDTTPPGEGQAPGQVITTQRRGYLRGDVVLRYAEVVVARDPAPAAQSGSQDA